MNPQAGEEVVRRVLILRRCYLIEHGIEPDMVVVGRLEQFALKRLGLEHSTYSLRPDGTEWLASMKVLRGADENCLYVGKFAEWQEAD